MLELRANHLLTEILGVMDIQVSTVFGLATTTVDSCFLIIYEVFELTLSESHAVVILLWFVALCIVNG